MAHRSARLIQALNTAMPFAKRRATASPAWPEVFPTHPQSRGEFVGFHALVGVVTRSESSAT